MEEENNEVTIDIESAVAEIGEGLGFDVEENEDEVPAGEVASPAAPATPAATSTETPAAPAAATNPATAPAVPDPLAVAPRTWRPEAAAEWAALPPTVKAEIAKREEDAFRGIEQYKGDARVGQGFKQAIGKYLPILQQHNIDPMQQVAGLMEAHQTLALGTSDQKLALFQKLAEDYGVSLADAAINLPPYRDPEVVRLQKELQDVKSSMSAAEQHRAQQQRAEFEAEVTKFQSDPANLYFNELVNDMAELLEKGLAKNIKEAYDKAAKLNPVVSAKEQVRVTAEATKKAAEDAAAKAAAAKAATAANVRSRARAGSAATPVGSIDDTLQATYREIMSRG